MKDRSKLTLCPTISRGTSLRVESAPDSQLLVSNGMRSSMLNERLVSLTDFLNSRLLHHEYLQKTWWVVQYPYSKNSCSNANYPVVRCKKHKKCKVTWWYSTKMLTIPQKRIIQSIKWHQFIVKVTCKLF